jgi:transposase
MDRTCTGCGAPAEAIGEPYSMKGVHGYQDIVVWFEQRRCAAGHIYQAELFEEPASDDHIVIVEEVERAVRRAAYELEESGE